MVLETITERGVLSKQNCVSLDSSINNTDYNAAIGTATASTINTITLAAGGSFVGKVIEIIGNTGENQARLITDITGAVATVSPNWDTIPDNTSIYVVHQFSGACPIQTQTMMKYCMIISADSPNIDNYFTGACMKILNGHGKNQIFEITEHTGSSHEICVSPRFQTLPLENTLYAIYGEGGLTVSATADTIVLDGNQSSAVKSKQYIEIIDGLGTGQIRMIDSISTNTVTITTDWDVIPDTTSRYTIFGGWGSLEGYESILRYTIITSSSTIDVNTGERAILILESSMDTKGIAELRNLTEISSSDPSSAHAITVVTEFFRLKIVAMGTSLNGTIQTILNSYKSGKVTSHLEETIYKHSDCELNRAVIAGKTPGGSYQNATVDHAGNLHTTIKSPIDAFGSIKIVQPRQYAELMFLNNYINPAMIITEVLNSATVSSINNVGTVTSGTNALGKATLYSLRRMRYNPGLAVNIRFTAVFSPPIANSVQLIGYGDNCDGLFLGYHNTDFGILFRRGGRNEIRRLTVTTVSSADDTITVTLNGVASSSISILSTDNTYQIARKIAATSFAAIGCGWDVYEEGATVLFVARTSGSLSGSYSYTPNASNSVGTFASIQTGIAAVDTWILQRNWNCDRALGNHDLPVINPQNGNVFEIEVQWLGFGNITFRMEHPEIGTFFNIHQIQYANKYTATSLLNPNLPLYLNVEKSGADSANTISVGAGSMGLFVMGDNNKVLGPRLGISNWYSTSTGALTGGTYYNMLAIRNMVVFNNLRNYNEVYILALSVCLNSGSSITRGGMFTFFMQTQLNNAAGLTWTKRNQYTSTIEYSKDVVTISGGTELLSFPVIPNQSIVQTVTELEVYIPPGAMAICAFRPFDTLAASPVDQAADIVASVSWIQR
jgi:hypothetical protein